MLARADRCGALPRPDDAEVARLVAEYRARGGAITVGPPVCGAPVRNGDGLCSEARSSAPAAGTCDDAPPEPPGALPDPGGVAETPPG